MATPNQTQRRATTAGRSAAAKRRSAAAKRAAAAREATPKTPVEQVQHAAERVVLIPVGAALTATDRVAETVTDLTRTYSTRETAQKRVERDLRRFERRGSTARNRAERRIKRTRTRVERELRQRRTRAVRVVKRNRTELERQARNVRRDLGRVVSDAQDRVANAA